MNKTTEILKIVDEKSPGLLDAIAQEDSISKEELIGKGHRAFQYSNGAHTTKQKKCRMP